MTQKIPLNDLMNALRTEMSPTYQDRIPELSDDNFREFANGMANPTVFNEWFNALVNRIGLTVLRNKAWSNPLAPLKKGKLEMGETIQEIFIDLIKAKKWKSFTTEGEAGRIYKTEPPRVYSAYFKINREDVYEVSYNEVDIKRAFVDRGSLVRFIDTLYNQLNTSDQFDEYLYMKQLMKTYDDKGLFHYVTVPELADLELPTLISQVKSMSTKMSFISDKFAGLQVSTHAPREDQYIYISADLDALIDVNVLASAFNMNKVEFMARRIVLDEMPIENALLILASKDWLNVYESLREFRIKPNEQTLEIKLFYHVHQAIFTSLFEPAVIFTTTVYEEPATVKIADEVLTEGVLNVEKGQYITIPTQVLDTTGSDVNVNQSVVFSLSGNTSQTRMEGNRLYVDLLEGAEFFIMVSALHDKDVNKEYKVTVE